MACITLPTAMLIGTAVTGIGGLASSLIGSNAASTAASQEVAAAGKATKLTQAMFNDVKGFTTPYIQTGTDVGLKGISNLLGGGSMNSAQITDFLKQLPGYQFTLDQGLKSVQNSYAAQGLGSSGAAIRGGEEFASGLASQTYQSLFTNFLNTAQLGESAAGALGGVATTTQGNINNLITGAGTAAASGTVGAANALTGGINALTGSASNNLLTLGLYNSGYFGNNGVGAANGNSLIPSNWNATRGFY